MNTISIILYGFGMEAILAIVIFVIFIILIRLLGAWMLRINEVIKLLKEILEELRKQKAK